MIENLALTPISMVKDLSGLSTDIKPVKKIGTGSTFYEVDTGNKYIYSVLNVNPATQNGWWKIPTPSGGGVLPMSINDIIESSTRVFVTPEQRDMIGKPIDLSYVFLTAGNEENTYVPVPGSVNVGTLSLAGTSNAYAEGFRTVALGGRIEEVLDCNIEMQTITPQSGVYGYEVDSYIYGLTDGYNGVYQLQVVSVDEENGTITVTGLEYSIVAIMSADDTNSAHAEGTNTKAIGMSVHAEGNGTKAFKENSHAEGYYNEVYSRNAHAEGARNRLLEYANNSHVEGFNNTVEAEGSHVEGEHNTNVKGKASHVEGSSNTTTSNAYYAHVEGYRNEADARSAHAEGECNKALASYSHAEGQSNTINANANASHAEGYNNTVDGQYAHAEGSNTTAKGFSSHTEGMNTKAYDRGAHAEGNGSIVGDPEYSGRANFGHAEGLQTSVQAQAGHAEGTNTTVSANSGHAEGTGTTASGDFSHAQGNNTVASAAGSHAGGMGSQANGVGSFAHGQGAIANGPFQVVFGSGNVPNATDMFILGNGSMNIFGVDVEGYIYQGPDSVSDKITKLTVATEENSDIIVPTDNAVYILKLSVDSEDNIIILSGTTQNILLGAALTDITITHSDVNTWNIANASTTDTVEVSLKRFM